MPTQDIATSGPVPQKGHRLRVLERLPRLHRATAETSGAWLRVSLFALLALSPLPLGSNRAVWWTLIAMVVGVLLSAYAYRIWTAKERPGLGLWPVMPIVLPYMLAMLWAIFQMLPLPSIGFTHPLWSLTSEALGEEVGHYISLDPHRTGTGIMRLLTYGGVFWLALQFGRERGFAERLLRVVTWVGLIYATYGVLMHVFGVERILWIPKQAYLGFLTSTFVNRNSYATFAALGLICAVAVLLHEMREVLLPPMESKRRWMGIIQTLTGKGAIPLMAACILGTALLQTQSRAGIVCTLIGLLVFMIAAGFAQLIHWRQTILPTLFIVLITVISLTVSGTNVLSRLNTINEDRLERHQMYELTARAVGDAPVIGTGLGTFESIFKMYRNPSSFKNTVRISNAHNSYLENALELGLPAAIMLIAAIGGIFEACLVALWKRKRGRLFPAVGLAAITVVGLHSIVDFSLEIPAVTITFAAIAGVACAQCFRSSRKTRLKFKVLPQTDGSPATADPTKVPSKSSSRPSSGHHRHSSRSIRPV